MIYVSTESVRYILNERPEVAEYFDGQLHVPALIFEDLAVDESPGTFSYSNVALGGVYIKVLDSSTPLSPSLGHDWVESMAMDSDTPRDSFFEPQVEVSQ